MQSTNQESSNQKSTGRESTNRKSGNRKSASQKTVGKICLAVILTIGVIAILGFRLWLFCMFDTAELHANCDNGLTVWRRNPGAFASYRYEIRNGNAIIKSGLTRNQLHDTLGETACLVLGGG